MQLMWMKKLNHIYFKKDRKFYFLDKHHINLEWQYVHQGEAPISMHALMFTQSVEQFSNEEQRNYWLPKCMNLDIIGCYAQTELGHGSNVGGLETEAVYDKVTDEFIINTPTITATKWWPGDMGRFANHALVMARLIIEDDGEKNDYGIAPFIVPMRD